MAHGDYCDEATTYVIKALDLTQDQQGLVTFLQTVGPTGGGDLPECYERVLHDTQRFAWRMDSIKALIMVGDAYPHEVDDCTRNPINNPSRLDWRHEVRELKQMGVAIYSIQALANRSGHGAAHLFWKTLAEQTNGYHLYLDQFYAVRDVLLAVCLKQAGDERVQAFEQEMVQRPAGLSASMKAFFDTMLKRAPAAAPAPHQHRAAAAAAAVPAGAAPAGVAPCPPAKYQVLDVLADGSIKSFVAGQPGLTFKAGNGYYEFTKPETISNKKAIVLMAADGTLYEGDAARAIAGIPAGAGDKKLVPGATPAGYRIFVQSSSVNRVLKAGTSLLYKPSDWVDS